MKVRFLLLLFATTNFVFGQSSNTQAGLTKEALLEKSKKQKTLCWIIGGAGLGLFTVGSIMYMSEFGNGLPGGTGYNEKTSRTGETLMYAGGGLALISIPLQLAYKRNQKIAASLSLENRRSLYPQSQDAASRFNLFLSMKINLGSQYSFAVKDGQKQQID